jgi:hypothetical protein
LLVTIGGVDLAAADGLACAAALGLGSCEKQGSGGRGQNVDLAFGRECVASEREAASERDRVVCEVADDAAVGVAVLLFEVVGDRQADFGILGTDVGECGGGELVEGMRNKDSACEVLEVVRACLLDAGL